MPPGFGEARTEESDGLDRYYDSMFRERAEIFPQALELDFWREHFIMQACRASGVLRGRLVDLGCGSGEVDVLLPTTVPEVESVVGVDISDVGLDMGRAHLAREPRDVRRRVRFLKADIGATGLPGGTFDSALLSHTLEHLANPAPVLREAARLLTPEGRLLVLVPIEHNHDDPDHKWHLDLDGYRRLLSRYGDVERAWPSDEDDQLALVMRPRRHATVTAIVRVRDEERLLPGLLDTVGPIADSVVVLDDRSVDGTRDIYDAHPLVTRVVRNDSTGTDEVRDKNLLLDAALLEGSDWILAMDADDRLEDGAAALLRQVVDGAPPWVDCVAMDYRHLWDAPSQARFDGAYGRDIRHPRLFHAEPVRRDGLRFAATAHGGNFHCGSVPRELADEAISVPVRLLHVGYLDSRTRERKAQFYGSEDPSFAAAGYYDHIRTPPTTIVPVTGRRDALEAARWSPPEPGVDLGVRGLPETASVVLVDDAVPGATVRALHETRALYLVRVGRGGEEWADLTVATVAEGLARAPVDTVVVSPLTSVRSLLAIRRARRRGASVLWQRADGTLAPFWPLDRAAARELTRAAARRL